MANQRDKFEAWKYLLDDFLEIACSLDEKERGVLIEKMASSGRAEGTIFSHPAFSTSGKLIAFAPNAAIRELWIYDAEMKEIKSFRLVETPEAGNAETYL